MSLEPGEMTTRVVYQAESVEVDAVGQPLKTWTDVFACWAAVRPLSAKELYYGQSTRSETTHRIAIRWRPGVDSKGRFLVANNRSRSTRSGNRSKRGPTCSPVGRPFDL